MTIAKTLPPKKPEQNIAGLITIFLPGGFAIALLMMLFIAIANIVWTSFIAPIPDDPNITLSMKIIILICAVIYYAYQFSAYAIVVSTITGVAGYKIFHALPLWYLLVVLPLCILAICFQTRQEGYLWGEINIPYIIESLIPVLISYLLARLWLKRNAAN